MYRRRFGRLKVEHVEHMERPLLRLRPFELMVKCELKMVNKKENFLKMFVYVFFI